MHPWKKYSGTFVCGVAKPDRRVRSCPQEKKHFERCYERFLSETSISHHKQSLNRSSGFLEGHKSRVSFLNITCESRVPPLTLRDVVNTKSACICRKEKVIGKSDYRQREGDLESIKVRGYIRKNFKRIQVT